MAGGHGPIKGEAWSPAGGWYFIPKNWKGNTIVVLGGLAVVTAATWAIGRKVTYQTNAGTSDEVIGRWNAAARKARESSALNEVTGSQ